MSTRSWIFNEADGACRGVYCHFDGYPEYTGKVLLENYNKNNIGKLLDLGDLSSLDTTLETCTAYHRDYGEDMAPNMVFDSPAEILKKAHKSDPDYVYLLNKNGVWQVAHMTYEQNIEFKDLKEVLNAGSGTESDAILE